MASVDARQYRHVRVLWDIENLPIPSKVSTLDALGNLRLWLQHHLRLGSADVRISVTYCPGKMSNTFGNSTAHLLDRSGVEQIFCSRKVEDADRKIIARLHQEAAVLAPASTAFVLISSDLDFNAPIATLTAQGFKFLVLCNRNSRTQQCFSLHASAVFQWEEIASGQSSSTIQPFTSSGVEKKKGLRTATKNLDRDQKCKMMLVPSNVMLGCAASSSLSAIPLTNSALSESKLIGLQYGDNSNSSTNDAHNAKLNSFTSAADHIFAATCEGNSSNGMPAAAQSNGDSFPVDCYDDEPLEDDDGSVVKDEKRSMQEVHIRGGGDRKEDGCGSWDNGPIDESEALERGVAHFCSWVQAQVHLGEHTKGPPPTTTLSTGNPSSSPTTPLVSPPRAPSRKVPATSTLIGRYYDAVPGSAAMFQGKFERLYDAFPEIKIVLAEVQELRIRREQELRVFKVRQRQTTEEKPHFDKTSKQKQRRQQKNQPQVQQHGIEPKGCLIPSKVFMETVRVEKALIPEAEMVVVTEPSGFMKKSSLDGASAALVESMWSNWNAVRAAANESSPAGEDSRLCFPEVGVPRVTSTSLPKDLLSKQDQMHLRAPDHKLGANLQPRSFLNLPHPPQPFHEPTLTKPPRYFQSLALRLDATEVALGELYSSQLEANAQLQYPVD